MRNLRIILSIIVVVSVLVGMTGCSALVKDKGMNVALQLKRENLAKSSVLVFNFKEPGYAAGAGLTVAEMFHTELLKKKLFKVVSLRSGSAWDRLGNTEEERLMQTMEEGKERQFDYILVGEVRDYFYGGINRTRVLIRVRIIEVSTRTTVFLADNYEEAKSKDPSYPLTTKLSKRARVPREVAGKVVEELIKKIAVVGKVKY